jgi:hypothetical protein
MFLIVAKYLLPKGFRGLTIYPFVIVCDVKDKGNKVFLNHESIHIKQQLEMLVLPFFVWYGLEFLVRLLHYKKWHLAYRNICFEREAYACEGDCNYLKNRAPWSFIRYLKRVSI